jgi:hypothetical protein
MRREVHRSEERGKVDAGWLHSRHSFSFGDYYNSRRMGFGALRVLNDDVIGPGKGFGTHPHDNMEIITIVLEGELAHKDSTRSSGVLKPGEVETKEKDVVPNYDQRFFPAIARRNKFLPIASGMNHKGALYIHQDAALSIASLAKDKELEYVPDNAGRGRGMFLFVIEGRVNVGGEVLARRDAIALDGYPKLRVQALKDAELLMIDVPMAP